MLRKQSTREEIFSFSSQFSHFAELKAKVDRVMRIATKQQYEKGIDRLTERVVKEVLGKHDGKRITEEMVHELSSKLAVEFVEFMYN